MARQENLTVVKAGLSRQRTKGAALKDTLFDLLNGYVTSEKTVRVRPGTLLTETLTAGTVGLVHFDGGFHVFASATVAVPSGYTLHILKSPDDSSFAVTKIHFAEPFMGGLYVAVEFAGGNIYHYWLQPAVTWVLNTAYEVNETVAPATPNGFVYRARRLAAANASWSAGTPRAVDDVVEPTTENGFKYTVTEVVGPTPRSGDVEPEWPERIGATIIEDLDDSEPPTPTVPPTPARPPRDWIDSDREERYGEREPFTDEL